ncbi:MAG TPA: hypothetical protein VIU82_03820 [Bosea sp. (in: a-proteobacteria)]
MSRTRTIRLALLLSVLLAPAGMAEAAGPRTGSFASAPRSVASVPKAFRPVAAGLHQRVSRSQLARPVGLRDHGNRHLRRAGPGLFTSAGFIGPWAYPTSSVASPALSADEDGPQRWVDPNSFENMPVRMGIVRAPTPEPTIYRLEGRRDRPATRVIRISEPEPPNRRRSRFAHAETGALLLIVPGR